MNCFVQSCTNSKSTNPPKQFFSVTQAVSLSGIEKRRRWIIAAGKNPYQIMGAGARVCEDHFEVILKT